MRIPDCPITRPPQAACTLDEAFGLPFDPRCPVFVTARARAAAFTYGPGTPEELRKASCMMALLAVRSCVNRDARESLEETENTRSMSMLDTARGLTHLCIHFDPSEFPCTWYLVALAGEELAQ